MSAKPSSQPTQLAHHFEDTGQQHEVATLGMWVFLGTELMFFGGLFLGYIVYRHAYPAAFAAGSRHLNIWIAGGNTIVLLTSSLAMALAVYGAHTNRRNYLVNGLIATIVLALGFLGLKNYEYYLDYDEGLVPVLNFDATKFNAPPIEGETGRVSFPGGGEIRDSDSTVVAPASVPREKQYAAVTEGTSFSRRVELFYMFYYVMTGIHALHMIVGIGIMSVLLHHARQGKYHTDYYYPVEVTGLYWHFVDVVWIFLLPLLYLIGGAH